MCSMNAFIILTISLCSTLLISSIAADLVPVFIWESSSDGEPTVFSTSAIAKVGKNELKSILQERFQHEPIVLLFAEENLSVEDFSWRDESGAGIYLQLENLTSSSDASSVYLPFVDGPLEVLLHSFPTNGLRWSKANVGPAGVPTLNVNVPNSNFLLVSLEDATDSDDRPSLLRRHDAFITEIYKSVLEKHKHVIGIYTARHSSWHSRSRRIREAPASSDDEDTQSKGSKEGDEVTKDRDISENLDEKEEEKETTQSREKATKEGEEEERGEEAKPEEEGLGTGVQEEKGENTQEFIEDFGEKKNETHTPIMTIPIASGLLVTALFLVFVSFGLTALSEIKTNSRYDDPKGKQLVISAE